MVAVLRKDVRWLDFAATQALQRIGDSDPETAASIREARKSIRIALGDESPEPEGAKTHSASTREGCDGT
jgi:hypothetical protein